MPNYLLLYKRKLLFVFLFFFLSCFLIVNKVRASETLLLDNFDSINPSRWSLLNEGNVQIQYDNKIKFLNSNSRRSTFLQNNEPFISNNIDIEVRFQFDSAGFGSGIAINDNSSPLRSSLHPGSSDWTIFVWPYIGSSFRIISSICPEFGPCVADNVLKTVDGINYSLPHTLRILYSNERYSVYFDDEFLGNTIQTSRSPRYIWFGNPMITSTDIVFARFYLDSVNVIDNSAPSFPYYSQLNPDWKDIEYDSASSWAGPDKNHIGRWGCALTSVSMVLKNYGVKDISGADATPDKLNSWLKSQSDGYIGPGLINWLAVTRYVREAYEAGKSDTKLEYTRGAGQPTTLPSIVNEGGHFVVTHASDSTSFQINDPNNEERMNKLKTETFLTNNTFTPSETDLSYFLLVKNPNLTYELKDSLGNMIPLNWVEEYLRDDSGGDATGNLSTALIAKPASGMYKLTIINGGSGNEEVGLFLYDEQGRVKKTSIVGAGMTILDINYNKIDSSSSTVLPVDTEPPSKPTMLGFLNPNIECGGYTNSKYVTVDWSDSTDNVGVARYEYHVNYPLTNGVGRSDWYTSFTSSQYRGSLNEGVHYVQVRAIDTAGNKSEWSENCVLTYDSIKPVLVSRTEYGGWYNTPPTSYFHYTDTNLVDYYTDPSCVIDTEGVGSTCAVTPNVCDKAGNCNTDSVSSNPVNTDWTAPKAPRIYMIFGWWNQIWAQWSKVPEAALYEVWIGTKKNALTLVGVTTNNYWWSGYLKQGQYYVSIRAIDQAANKSGFTPLWKVEVHKKWDHRWF